VLREKPVPPAVGAHHTGARWHADDLRRGGDQAPDARDRRTPLDDVPWGVPNGGSVM